MAIAGEDQVVQLVELHRAGIGATACGV